MHQGIVVLAHQMLSMVEPICSYAHSLGLKCYVVSSKPIRAVEASWSLAVDGYAVASAPSLNLKDVTTFIATLPSNVDIAACISVWDGYRTLMSDVNKWLGAPDISSEQVGLMRDKFTLRQTLQQHGLSNVNAMLLTQDIAETLSDKRRWFVKPVTGLASMGTFRATSLTGWEQLRTLWATACSDQNYAGVFSPQPNFMLEEYIEGTECSFEVLVAHGKQQVLAVHEKVCVTHAQNYVQEGACVSPPISLSQEQRELGEQFVSSCISALKLDAGAYHIEAKCDNAGHWEVIEINPRIGGAYIVPSTTLLSGVNLLQAWIQQLLGLPITHKSIGSERTFFRVYFGDAGKKVESIGFNSNHFPPSETRLSVAKGSQLPHTEREIFLGQALWHDVSHLTNRELKTLVEQSTENLDLEYDRENHCFA